MDTSQKMFLLAVEEMNFTRAARRAHVTQQCLSEHIKSLEIELGTKLFTRSPRLAITDSGIVLQKTLQRISNLEKNLHVKIQEIEKGQIGEIHLGINATRAHILLPRLLPAFHSLYPKVNLIATLQDTEELVARMLNQELDVIFGIDYPAPPLLTAVPAEEEILILTATNQFLHRYYQGPEPWHDLQPGDYLDFRQFSAFPIVGNRKKSTVQHLYTTFLREQGLSHQQIVSISDYATQFELCREHLAAAFSSSFMYHMIRDYNRACGPENAKRLIPLRIKNMDYRIKTRIIIPKRPFIPRYMQDFVRLFTQEVRACQKETSGIFGI